MTGTSLYLKSVKPDVIGLGYVLPVPSLYALHSCIFSSVLTAPNDRVPGPRTYNLLVPVEFPWREAMDDKEEVDSFSSYQTSLELCRNGLLVGPSSGLTLKGLINYLERRKAAGTLDQLRNSAGEIQCK
jgi:cysteine synthase